MNSEKAHFLVGVKAPATHSRTLEARNSTGNSVFESRVERHIIYGWFGPSQFIRGANSHFTLEHDKTHTSTELQTATFLVYKLGCLTRFLKKYCHSCKISNSLYFTTITAALLLV